MQGTGCNRRIPEISDEEEQETKGQERDEERREMGYYGQSRKFCGKNLVGIDVAILRCGRVMWVA